MKRYMIDFILVLVAAIIGWNAPSIWSMFDAPVFWKCFTVFIILGLWFGLGLPSPKHENSSGVS